VGGVGDRYEEPGRLTTPIPLLAGVPEGTLPCFAVCAGLPSMGNGVDGLGGVDRPVPEPVVDTLGCGDGLLRREEVRWPD
jgi:hypothetical protein